MVSLTPRISKTIMSKFHQILNHHCLKAYSILSLTKSKIVAGILIMSAKDVAIGASQRVSKTMTRVNHAKCAIKSSSIKMLVFLMILQRGNTHQ